MQETQVQSLGWEDPLEKERVTYSSILLWRILEENPSRVLCPWGRKRVILSNEQQEQKLLVDTVQRGKGKMVNKIKTSFPLRSSDKMRETESTVRLLSCV